MSGTTREPVRRRGRGAAIEASRGEAALRVAIDGAILRRPLTGIGRWVLGLTAALQARPELDVHLVDGPRLLTRGGRLHRVPNLLRERWWYDAGMSAAARRLEADVMLLPANLGARRSSVPQVVTIHDVNFLTIPDTYERSFVRYATWAFSRALRDADMLTTDSAFSRDEICRHLGGDPARFTVVYPGLSPVPGAAPPSPLDRPYALCVTATEVHKNLGLLMDAWEGSSLGGLTLVLVGQPGRDHENLLGRAARLSGRVIVRGGVGGEELEAWYRHASVFVFPSRTEGFGYPPLEAMQRGIPVVSSTGGSLPEVLGDAALYHDPDDAPGLRAHVERLVADQQERERLIALGFARTRRYTWDQSAAAMTAVLRAAATSGRGS